MWKVIVAVIVAVIGIFVALDSTITGTVPALREKYTVYPFLDPATHDIRILELEPGLSGLHTTLRPAKFVHRPEYIALSYAWGTENADKSILIDQRSMLVRTNLFNALSAIRNPSGTPVNLWVDAICIDQANAEEKNLQVPTMDYIYRRAKEVVIWLGYSHSLPYELRSYEYKLENLPTELTRMRKSTPNKFNELWFDLEPFIFNLIYEEYWKRLWIIQEVCLATKLYVQFGSNSRISWDSFVKLVRLYEKFHARDPRAEIILNLATTRLDIYSRGEAYSLMSLLNTYKNAFCQDPRDKIYGFLGMASDLVGHEIPVDYRKSLPEVYADVIRFFNLSTIDSERKRIEMVYTASLVRRLLTRKGEPIYMRTLDDMDFARKSEKQARKAEKQAREKEEFI